MDKKGFARRANKPGNGKRKRLTQAMTLSLCGLMLIFQLSSATAFANEANFGLCEHHPAHTEECGYSETDTDATCNFVCTICPVQEMIEALPSLAELQEQDAEAQEASYAQIMDAYDAYDALTSDEQAQVSGIGKLESLLSYFNQGISPADSASDITLTSVTIADGDGTGSSYNLLENNSFTIPYSKAMVLNVAVASELNVSNKTVKITVPDGLEITDYTKDTTSFITAVDFEPSSSDYGGYKPEKSGTLTYSLSEMAENETFNITLAVDTVLWSGFDNAIIADALKVETFAGNESTQTVQTEAKATITGSRGQTLSSWDTNIAVPASAGTPFLMRSLGVYHATGAGTVEFPTYYKELHVTVSLPYNEMKGVYGELEHLDAQVKPDKIVADTTGHNVTFVWYNLYAKTIPIKAYFKWGEDATVGDIVKWPKPTGKAVYRDDSTRHLDVSNRAITDNVEFVVSDSELMTIQRVTRPAIYSDYNADPNIVYSLCMSGIRNDGLAASAKKTVEFTYKYDDKIGVTAQAIPVPTNSTATNIKYRTNKNGTLRSYSGSAIKMPNTYLHIFTAQMAGLSSGEYFTYIQADVGSYEKGYVGYQTSAIYDPVTNRSITFGKLLSGDVGTYPNFCTLKIRSTEDPSDTGVKQLTDLTVTDTSGYQTLQLTPPNGSPLSTSSAVAGETVSVSAVVSGNRYPYSNNQIIPNTELYIRLPGSISLKNLQLLGRTSNRITGDLASEPLKENDDYTIKRHHTEATTGYVVYKIEFTGNSGKIGWFNENLGERQIRLSFDMDISLDAPAMSLNLRDCILGTSKTVTINSAGSATTYLVKDTYDADNDGNTEEYMGTFDDKRTDSTLTVMPARRGLLAEMSAKLGSETDYYNYDDDAKTMPLTEDDVIDVNLSVFNNSNGAISKEDADKFHYYIPVPKTGDNWDSLMQNKAFSTNMNLTGPAAITETNADMFKVQYSTTVNSSASKGSGQYYDEDINTNYVDADKISDWTKVKMIRVSVADGVTSIPANVDAYIALQYKADDDASNLVGNAFQFSSVGYTGYTVSGAYTSGYLQTKSIRGELQTGILSGYVYIDKNFNGIYESSKGDLLYTDSAVTVKITDVNDPTNTRTVTTSTGRYEVRGLKQGTYTVEVTNPGSANASGSNPLRFSLAADSIFTEDQEHTIATATISVSGDNVADNKGRNIGLQQPHTVTFSADNANLSFTQMRVWHNNKIELIPEVTATAGWFYMQKWTTKDGVKTPDEVRAIEVNEDMTLVAVVGKLFNLNYDGNTQESGQVDGLPTAAKAYLSGTSVTLSTTTPTHSDVDGRKVLFLGWTETQTNKIYTKNDIAPTTVSNVTILDADKTVYAAWGYDKNGEGTPDVFENKYKLLYDSNAQTGNAGNVPTDNEAYLKNTKVTLSTTKPAHSDVDGKKVLFLGWTETQTNKIYTKNDIAPTTVSNVTILDADKTVYAAWGYDENGEDTPDVNEDKYSLIYDANAKNGDVENVPTDSEHYLKNTKVTLSTTTPTHSAVDGRKVLFLGWTETQTNKIYGKDDTAPTLVTEVTIPEGDKTVYAAWGYDENNNGTADVFENKYNLIYNGNAQNGNVESVPEDTTNYLTGTAVTLSDLKPTHSNVNGRKVVFIGWTETPTTKILSTVAPAPATVTQITVEGANKTVYAAWRYVASGGSGTPQEEKYRLLYDGNAQSGTVYNVPTDHNTYTKGTLVNLSAAIPTHSDLNKIAVLFIGWTENKTTKIYAKNDTAPTTVTQVIMSASDKTVYAAWSYDENGNDIPDVFEDDEPEEPDDNDGEVLPPNNNPDNNHDSDGLPPRREESKDNDNNLIPKTGDEQTKTLLIYMMLMAISGSTVLVFKRKNK